MYDNVFYPQIVRLDATWRCNLNCKHCQTGMFRGTDHPEDLSDADWSQLFEELARLGTRQVNFLGGEPLLRKTLLQHVAHLTRLGIHSDVTTNGILIREENARALLTDNQATVTVSLDGATSATHDHIRGRTTFTRATQAIKTLVRVREQDGAGHVGLSVVLNRNNLHETEAVVDLAQDLGVDSLIIAAVHKVGNAIQYWEDLSIDGAQLYDAGVRIAQHLTRNPVTLDVRVNFFTSLFRDHLSTVHGLPLRQEPMFDRASLYECYIQCDGLVYPSQKFSEMNPEILAGGAQWGVQFDHNALQERSFQAIWEGEEFNAYRDMATALRYVAAYDTCRECAFSKTYCIPNAGAAVNGESSPQLICSHLFDQTREHRVVV